MAKNLDNVVDKTLDKKFQQSGRVKTVKGSILNPHYAGLRFVLNVANMAGKLESPLYPIFKKRWSGVEREVRGWYATKTGAYKLGAIHNLATQSDVWVISMLCQNEELQTDLNGLETCLKEVSKLAKYEKASVHVSVLLVDLIPELSELLDKCLVKQGVSVSYYEQE